MKVKEEMGTLRSVECGRSDTEYPESPGRHIEVGSLTVKCLKTERSWPLF